MHRNIWIQREVKTISVFDNVYNAIIHDEWKEERCYQCREIGYEQNLFLFYLMISFHPVDIIWIQTAEQLVMFFDYKSMVANYTEMQKEWDGSSANRRHRDRNGEDHRAIEKELWHACMCDFKYLF